MPPAMREPSSTRAPISSSSPPTIRAGAGPVSTNSPSSRHRRRVEQHQRVRELPLLGPGLLAAAGHLEHQAEELPADLPDRPVAVGDAAGVAVPQASPAAREVPA